MINEIPIKTMLTTRMISDILSEMFKYTMAPRMVKVKIDSPMLSLSRKEIVLKNGSVSFWAFS